MAIRDFLSNSKLVFFISILASFLIPGLSGELKNYIVPVLMVMMTFSVKDVAFRHISRSNIKSVVYLVLTNYIFFTGIFLLLTRLFVENPLFRNALYINAIMPPAISIISMSYILKADVELGFISEFSGYVLGIFIIPILSLFLFGGSVSAFEMVKVLFYVVIIPFILSRFIHSYEKKHKHMDKKIVKSVINLCYAFSFYVMIGINMDVFFSNYLSLIPIALILIFLKFGIGTSIYLFLKHKMKKKMDVLYVLFATMKNGGAATAISILLFGVESTVPFAISAIIAPFYILYLEWFIMTKNR